MTEIKAGDDLGNGLVAVPREPTRRMIEMAWTCLGRLPADDRAKLLFLRSRDVHEIKMKARWAAMIGAAGHAYPDDDGRNRP